MASQSTLLAWEIPWTEEPGGGGVGGLQSMGSERVGHDWGTTHTHTYAQLKICSGPLYLWQDTDPCLDLDRLLLWQLRLADILKWFLSKYRVPSLYLASVGGSCHIWYARYAGRISCKTSMRLDQGSVCGAWEESRSRDVSLVEEAQLAYYMGLEVRERKCVRKCSKGCFTLTGSVCLRLFSFLFHFLTYSACFSWSFIVFFYFENRLYFHLFLCNPFNPCDPLRFGKKNCENSRNLLGPSPSFPYS